MASIKDDKGYNQVFERSETMRLRTERRADLIVGKMNLNGHLPDTVKLKDLHRDHGWLTGKAVERSICQKVKMTGGWNWKEEWFYRNT